MFSNPFNFRINRVSSIDEEDPGDNTVNKPSTVLTSVNEEGSQKEESPQKEDKINIWSSISNVLFTKKWNENLFNAKLFIYSRNLHINAFKIHG